MKLALVVAMVAAQVLIEGNVTENNWVGQSDQPLRKMSVRLVIAPWTCYISDELFGWPVPADSEGAAMNLVKAFSILFVVLFIGGAVGTTIWFGFFRDVHDYDHQASQEKRAAQVTGAVVRPVEPIKLTIKPHDCTHVKNVTIEGKQLTMYVQNDCHAEIDYIEYHWQSLTPDGTGIHSGWTNNATCPIPSRGHKAECLFEIEDDDRTASIEVWSEIR